MSDLRKKAIRGITYLGAGKSAGKLISFINTLILARILTPEDYGIMGMAMVVMGFVSFFNEIGLGSAIVQRQTITARQLSSCFFLSIVISSLLYTGLFLSADSVSQFYDNEKVGDILQAISLSLIFGGFATVPYSLLRKNMRFSVISMIEFVGILLQCAVTLVLAVFDYEVWSLVYGFICFHAFRLVSYVFVSRWLPNIEFSFSESIDLLKFGANVTYSRITWYFYTSIDALIIGKLLSDKLLGIYSMAMSLATLPTANITSLVINVASPLFAKLQDNKTQLQVTLEKMTYGLALVCFPILAGLGLVANELVPVLLGEQWLLVTPVLQILCGLGFFKSIDPLLTQILISTNHPTKTARYTTLCAIVVPSAIFFGAQQMGLIGAALGWLLSYPILFFILTFIVRKTLRISLTGYFKCLVTPVSAVIFMSIAIVATRWLLIDTFTALPLLLVEILVGVFSYAFWLLFIRKDSIDALKIMLLDLGVNEQKLDRWPFKHRGMEIR